MADYVHDDVRNYFATKKCVAHAHATAYAFLYFHSIEFFFREFFAAANVLVTQKCHRQPQRPTQENWI